MKLRLCFVFHQLKYANYGDLDCGTISLFFICNFTNCCRLRMHTYVPMNMKSYDGTWHSFSFVYLDVSDCVPLVYIKKFHWTLRFLSIWFSLIYAWPFECTEKIILNNRTLKKVTLVVYSIAFRKWIPIAIMGSKSPTAWVTICYWKFTVPHLCNGSCILPASALSLLIGQGGDVVLGGLAFLFMGVFKCFQ